MRFLALVTLTLVIIVFGSLMFGSECSPEYGTNTYLVQGKNIIISNNSSRYFINCNNNDVSFDYLPILNGNELNNMTVINCSFQSKDLSKIMDHMKVSTKHLILEEWNPLFSENFTYNGDLTGLELSNSHIEKLEYLLLDSLTNLTLFAITNSNLLSVNNLYLPMYLQILNLSGNKLKSLPNNFLQDMTKLKVLDLSRNIIETLPLTLFTTNSAMNELNLSGNMIRNIQSDFFSPLKKLKNLFLQRNNIKELSSDIFDSLVKLKVLNLANNLIQSLPGDIFLYNNQIMLLNLSHNQISDIAIQKLPTSIKTLDVSYNDFSDMCFIVDMNNLEYLNMSHNRVDFNCKLVWNKYKVLKSMDLSYNQYTILSFRDFLFQHNVMVMVDYRYNQIKTIDIQESDTDELGKLEDVFFLLEGNPIVCDEDLYRFMSVAIKNKMFNKTFEDIKCFAPDVLKNHFWSHVPLESLIYHYNCSEPLNTTKFDDCQCLYDDVNKLNRKFTLNCSSVSHLDLSSFVSYHYMDEVILIIENCNLTSLPDPLPKNVTELYAANNFIRTLPDLPNSLRVLDVSHNNISRMSADILTSTNRTLRLSHNNLSCDCENREFIFNILSTTDDKVLDRKHVSCSNGTQLHQLIVAELCHYIDPLWIVVPSIVVFFIVFLVLLGLCLRYEITVLLHSYGLLPDMLLEEEVDKNKSYDAFISYAHGDDDFVMNQLVPKLEGEYGFKLCIHHRDWLPGVSILSQIVKSVEDSRRTIVIVSKNFLKSVWVQAEVRAAIEESVRLGLPRVVMIMMQDVDRFTVDDLDLKAYLRVNTYLDVTDRLLWEKLNYALPHKKRKFETQFMKPLSKKEEEKRMAQLRDIEEFVKSEFEKLEKQKELNPNGLNTNVDAVNGLCNGITELKDIEPS